MDKQTPAINIGKEGTQTKDEGNSVVIKEATKKFNTKFRGPNLKINPEPELNHRYSVSVRL